MYRFSFSSLLCSCVGRKKARKHAYPELLGSSLLPNTKGLRRRTKRRVKGFSIYSDDEAAYVEYESSSDESCRPPSTPRGHDFDDHDLWRPRPLGGGDGKCDEDFVYGGEVEVCSPRILPVAADQGSMMSVQASLSFAESCVDKLGPYHELCEAAVEEDCEKAEKVLGRLLTEWYVVGASVSDFLPCSTRA